MAILGNTKAVSITLLDGVIGNLNPKVTTTYDLGTSSLKWNNIYGTLKGNADTTTSANLTTTANAVAYYTNTTGTFGTKASANGALYATSANGALTFGTLPVAQGGTGATSAANARTNLGLGTMATETASNYIAKSVLSGAYDIMYSSAANTPTRLAANTTSTKKFLRMTGTGSAGAAPAWDTVTKSDVGLGNVTNDAQIPKSIGTAKGDIIYWSAASTPARLAVGSAGYILKTGSGSVPAWSASPFHTALTSKGTTATTTAGETYGIAGVATGSSTTIYTKWYVNLDSGVTTPTNGMMIQIKIPVAGVNAGCAITIDNGSNFYPVAMSASSRVTTHFGVNDTITLQFDSARAIAAYGTKAGASNGNATVNITGCWRLMNEYDSGNTNTLLRTYSSATNINVPLIGSSSANSTTAAWSTYTGTYKDWYGVIPNDDAKRAKINLSTGLITAPGGLTAGVITSTTSINLQKIFLNNSNSYGSTLPTNATTTGQLYFTPPIGDANSMVINSTTDKIYLTGIKAAGDTTLYYNTDVYAQGSVLYGAAWNDYAEYRESFEVNPGRVIIELGNGRLIRSTERLQPGAEIVSDTYGFVIGKGNPRCSTPVAVCGRVLAYPYEDRHTFAAGDAVCSGPNGTVSKMTREEIKEYPDRIIGTVSEVPEYETWGPNNIKVHDRIWIRLR